jgi:hypothetical protein
LRIGFGIKRPSHREVGDPEALALEPALRGRQAVPVRPFSADEILGIQHGVTVAADHPFDAREARQERAIGSEIFFSSSSVGTAIRS